MREACRFMTPLEAIVWTIGRKACKILLCTGNIRTVDSSGPYNFTLLSVQADEIQGEHLLSGLLPALHAVQHLHQSCAQVIDARCIMGCQPLKPAVGGFSQHNDLLLRFKV